MQSSESLGGIDLDELSRAREMLRGFALRTPLLPFHGCVDDRRILLKPECLQKHGAYKIRCATYAVVALAEEQRSQGIFTASAGNFGQGVAAIAKRTGTPVRVYVPDTAAQTKIAAMRMLGAEIREVTFAQWWSILSGTIPANETFHFLHPCKGRNVIVANATIAAEILEDAPDIDAVLVPFGGGGLTLGIATGLRLLKPGVEVIACEGAGSTPLTSALRAGTPVVVGRDGSSFIDGIGGTMVLESLWDHLRNAVTATEVVSEVRAAEAVRQLFRLNHLVVEGAGAVPVAAAQTSPRFRDRNVVAILSGGNIDEDVLFRILSRARPPFKADV